MATAAAHSASRYQYFANHACTEARRPRVRARGVNTFDRHCAPHRFECTERPAPDPGSRRLAGGRACPDRRGPGRLRSAATWTHAWQGTRARSRRRTTGRPTGRGRGLETLALALLAYVPFLLSSPGRLAPDSKNYLYIDPAKMLSRVAYLWDPHVGFGTVLHQMIGYLFPMGPFFWLTERVGLPMWVAQRLWLGSLSFVAVLGARWLFHRLGIGRTGALAGALVYMLTPYQLAFTVRISVLLLAWAALPWLIGITMRAVRAGGWRDPALFALIILTIGGANASTLAFAMVGPGLWLVFEALGGRAGFRRAVGAGLRIGVLSAAVSLWWVVGLRTQGTYGLPVLQLTESLRTVAADSTPTDVLRGIGNWFFYGRDNLGYSIDQASWYSSNVVVQVASFAIPVLALCAAALVKWRHRAYFVVLLLVGTVISVGAWPYDDPSAYGGIFKDFAETSAGLALRNSPRAVPLVVLGLAGLLAAGVSAIAPVLVTHAPRGLAHRAGAPRGRSGHRRAHSRMDHRLHVAQSRPRGAAPAVLVRRRRRAAT